MHRGTTKAWTVAAALIVFALLTFGSTSASAATGHSLLDTFSTGPETNPQAVATDSSGNVSVLLANGGGRIARYDAGGNPIPFTASSRQIEGNQILGTPAGPLQVDGSGNTGLAVDRSGGPTDGNIYFAGPGGVAVFDSTGAMAYGDRRLAPSATGARLAVEGLAFGDSPSAPATLDREGLVEVGRARRVQGDELDVGAIEVRQGLLRRDLLRLGVDLRRELAVQVQLARQSCQPSRQLVMHGLGGQAERGHGHTCHPRLDRHEDPALLDQRVSRRMRLARVGRPGEDLHRHSARTVGDPDALIFGRTTYELMEFWRDPGDIPEGFREFADAINAKKKYLVSSTRTVDDWNAENLRGDPVEAVRDLKRQPGGSLLVGGVRLPTALAAAGLIDEFEFVVHPTIVGHGPTLFSGLPRQLSLELVGETRFSGGVVARTYVPVGNS